MKLTLPYPPSVNGYWRVFGGRILLSREGRAYKQKAAFIARQFRCIALKGPVFVLIKAYRPRRIGDLDNTLKATLDALRGVAFEDDSQVVNIVAVRADDKHNPRVEVEVLPAQDEAA